MKIFKILFWLLLTLSIASSGMAAIADYYVDNDGTIHGYGLTLGSGPIILNGVTLLPTGTELNYVDGVTSSIQSQINAIIAGEYVYPGAGIPLSTGVAWGTSITNNSSNWDTAYTDRLKWDGGATGLTAATGRTSLGLVIGTDVQAYHANLAAIIGGTWTGATSITTLGTIGTGSWHGTVIDADHGGTGQTVYAIGDILTASTTTALSRIADVAVGSYLRSEGVGVIPAWQTKAPIDSRDYATLALADAAAYAAGKQLLIAQNHTLVANTTLVSAIQVIKGGSFTKASTYTLAINGPFEAGLYQVFIGFSVGDVTFGATSVKEVYSQWCGASASASAEVNTNAINAAIKMANGRMVKLPSGVVNHTGVIISTTEQGMNLVGCGRGVPRVGVWSEGLGTVLHNTGAGANITIGSYANFVTISDLKLTGVAGSTDGIWIKDSTQCSIQRVNIVSWGTGYSGIKLDTFSDPANGTYYTSINDVDIYGGYTTNSTGLKLTGTVSGANRTLLNNVTVRACTVIGIDQQVSSDTLTVIGGELVQNAIAYQSISNYGNSQFFGVAFEGNTYNWNITVGALTCAPLFVGCNFIDGAVMGTGTALIIPGGTSLPIGMAGVASLQLLDSVDISGSSATTGKLRVFKGVPGVSALEMLRVDPSDRVTKGYTFAIEQLTAGDFNGVQPATIDNAGNAVFTTVTPAGLGTGYLPYKTSGALANSPIYTDGTNVGIGAANPAARLSITADATGPQKTIYLKTSDFAAGTTGSSMMIGLNTATGDTYSRIGAYKTGESAVANLVLQLDGGNVGIGTPIPRYKNTTVGVLSSLLSDDGTNYEGLTITPATGSVTLGAVEGGTGSNNIDLLLAPIGTGAVGISSLQTAGALTGTLTTSVATGNPTVWFRIKNGSSYYAVPGWLIP